MAKNKYIKPVLLDITPGEDPTIEFGGSQGTSGYDTPYSFPDIPDEILVMIDANCDDLDLAEMDADGDLIITLAEFQAWYDEYQPW